MWPSILLQLFLVKTVWLWGLNPVIPGRLCLSNDIPPKKRPSWKYQQNFGINGSINFERLLGFRAFLIFFAETRNTYVGTGGPPITMYNAILRIARNFLETRENIKISTHPFYHINLGWFSWEWSKKFFFENGRFKKNCQFWGLAILKISVFLSRPFWKKFLQKNETNQSTFVRYIAKMGWNFDDHPWFPANSWYVYTFATECMCIINFLIFSYLWPNSLCTPDNPI